jgi:hypothetical protein
MGNDTKVVAHEGTNTGMGIFCKCGYGKGHRSTLPIGYPLSSLIESIVISFSPSASAVTTDRYIRWNNNNFTGVILNVDGSCHGTPVRTGFGGLLRNDTGFFLAGFSGFIPSSDDILLGELSAIYHGLVMAKDLGYVEIACYYDSLTYINLINGPIERYHIYAFSSKT